VPSIPPIKLRIADFEMRNNKKMQNLTTEITENTELKTNKKNNFLSQSPQGSQRKNIQFGSAIHLLFLKLDFLRVFPACSACPSGAGERKRLLPFAGYGLNLKLETRNPKLRCLSFFQNHHRLMLPGRAGGPMG
jgi:hypothetical protein